MNCNGFGSIQKGTIQVSLSTATTILSQIDLVSDSEDRAGFAEEFQWSQTAPEQAVSLRILKYYTPLYQLSFFLTFHNWGFSSKYG